MNKKKWYIYKLSKKDQQKQRKIADRQNTPSSEAFAKALRFLADVYINEIKK